jgi:hypothetical protein
LKQFEITPDIYKRFIESINNNNGIVKKLDEILKDWKIKNRQEKILEKFI